MSLLDFYNSLPSLEVSNFYVKGYTEALKLYTGVRVIPDESYLEGISTFHQPYLKATGFPTYFIPICDSKNNCYGYTLKGQKKLTPRFCTNYYLPGLDLVNDNKPVVLVEGIKDSYLPLKAGMQVQPMFTAVPTDSMLLHFKQHNNLVIFASDNDSHTEDNITRFKAKADKLQVKYYIFRLQGQKDFGDFFEPSLRNNSLLEVKKLSKIYTALEKLQWNS